MKRSEFSLPVVRGAQGGHAFYSAMCPLRLLPRLFPVGVDQTTDRSRQSFRTANAERVRKIAREIVANRNGYHFAAVTISVETDVRFVAARGGSRNPVLGELFIPLEAPLAIIDGLHRILGLQRALGQLPTIANDCIAMLIHVDPAGLRRGEIFSDTKRFERTSAQSLRISLDDRDETARLTREVISKVPAFVDSIEMEKTAISNRSRKLFTLSALYQANRVLLADLKEDPYAVRLCFAAEFWQKVSSFFPEWKQIAAGKTSAAEIRANFVHCHAIGLAAIARAGRCLRMRSPNGWRKRLKKLSTLDWSRGNTKLWEGRAMVGGRLSKSSYAVARTGNAVKLHLGINLSKEEQSLE